MTRFRTLFASGATTPGSGALLGADGGAMGALEELGCGTSGGDGDFGITGPFGIGAEDDCLATGTTGAEGACPLGGGTVGIGGNGVMPGGATTDDGPDEELPLVFA